MLLDTIQLKIKAGKKLFALLIDPGKLDNKTISHIVKKSTELGTDLFLVGGSLVQESIDNTLLNIKS